MTDYEATAGAAERFAYLAENLAALHAAPDLPWLTGRFEFLGEKALGAAVTILALPDERGVYKASDSASPRPAATRHFRDTLEIASLWNNGAIRDAFAEAEQRAAAASLPFTDIFPGKAADDAGGADCVIIAPVSYNRELIAVGMFVLKHDENVEQMANILVAHTAVAMNQIRQREDARRLHSVDPRLWVPDEHFLLAQLRREVTRARRYGREVGLAVLHIGNQGELRHRFGDFFTDHLLRRIGAQFLATVRDSDVLGALAGDYAVIHTETGYEGTKLSADRLRDAVADMVAQRFPEAPPLDVSVGVVAFPESGATVEELLDRLAMDARRAA